MFLHKIFMLRFQSLHSMFLTLPSANLEARERYLKSKEFLDLIRPSFGLTTRDKYIITTIVKPSNVVISGDKELGPGRYMLRIKNNGLTKDGKVNLTIEIQ